MKLLPIILLSSLTTMLLTACPEKSSDSPLNAETDYTIGEVDSPDTSETFDSVEQLTGDAPSEFDSDDLNEDSELEIEE